MQDIKVHDQLRMDVKIQDESQLMGILCTQCIAILHHRVGLLCTPFACFPTGV